MLIEMQPNGWYAALVLATNNILWFIGSSDHVNKGSATAYEVAEENFITFVDDGNSAVITCAETVKNNSEEGRDFVNNNGWICKYIGAYLDIYASLKWVTTVSGHNLLPDPSKAILIAMYYLFHLIVIVYASDNVYIYIYHPKIYRCIPYSANFTLVL